MIIVCIFSQSKLIAQSYTNFDDYGIISIMYHRFEENKYPSTNIKLEVFKEQLKIIESENIQFVNPGEFKKNLIDKKKIEKFY